MGDTKIIKYKDYHGRDVEELLFNGVSMDKVM